MLKDFSHVLKPVFGVAVDKYPTVFSSSKISGRKGPHIKQSMTSLSLKDGKMVVDLFCLKNGFEETYSFMGFLVKEGNRGSGKLFEDSFVDPSELSSIIKSNLPKELLDLVEEEVSVLKKVQQDKKKKEESKKSKKTSKEVKNEEPTVEPVEELLSEGE